LDWLVSGEDWRVGWVLERNKRSEIAEEKEEGLTSQIPLEGPEISLNSELKELFFSEL